jgi:hypothetical protein
VFANLGRALAAAGARPDQVTKISIFVVGYRRGECLPTIEEGRVALSRSSSTLLNAVPAGAGRTAYHSIGCRDSVGGSPPAISQPIAAAANGTLSPVIPTSTSGAEASRLMASR